MPAIDLCRSIRDLVGPTVERAGFDLVAVEWVGDGRGPVLRLSIDHPSGVSASDCQSVVHEVSPLLDEADPISTRYSLEVSSPGIERPVQRIARCIVVELLGELGPDQLQQAGLLKDATARLGSGILSS